MKKYSVLILCLLVAVPLFAQRNLNKVEKAVQSAVRKSSPVKEKPRSASGHIVTAPVRTDSRALGTVKNTASTTGSVPNRSGGKMLSVPTKQVLPGQNIKLQSPLTQRQKDEAEALTLLKENIALREKKWAEMFETGIGKSVLFAPVESEGKTGGFSVTAVKARGEVFGVIASHVLPESYYTFNSSLKRSFHVAVKQANGTEKLLDAQVVQVSPRSMLDISLVKFSDEAEELVAPLEISHEMAGNDEELMSIGYQSGVPGREKRMVQQQSFLSVRTDQNLEGERQGFCGSPLLDGEGKVKAIHTGTKEIKDSPDVSYGTHAKFINLLIEAYHNNGQAFYDLVIDGQTLAQLNVDEYISAIYVYDANGKRLAQKNIEDKFSESFLRKTLVENEQAAYLQLTSRKAQWETDQDGDSILKEDRSRSDKTKRQHWYNLQTRQIEPTRPAIIKM